MFGAAGVLPITPIQRLKNYNLLGDHNTSGLGAPDAGATELAFIQKSRGSSNEDIPM